jgi:hypothetical protein
MKTLIRRTLLTALSVAGLLGASDLFAASLGPKPGPPRATYEGQYREMAKPYWREGFPSLGPGCEILAPSTGREDRKGAYNCIAHTLRIYDRWVWPGDKVSDFDHLYGSYGYRRINRLDYSFRPTTDKIVLYGMMKGGRVVCTHGARQLADGTWTSKLGGGPLIRHKTPDSVDGPSYGVPIAVYVRTRKNPNPATVAASSRGVSDMITKGN